MASEWYFSSYLMKLPCLKIHSYGVMDYSTTLQAMQDFTAKRTPATADEIWLLQHSAVYTQGRAGKAENLLHPTSIPVITTDRGGQITYHGEGQQIMYVLLDLKRLKINLTLLISSLENAVIKLLADYQILAKANPDAHGVYVFNHNQWKKIASLGLRIQNGCCFHGLSLNVNMDLSPFKHINPCGYTGLEMCQMADFVTNINYTTVVEKLVSYFIEALNFPWEGLHWSNEN